MSRQVRDAVHTAVGLVAADELPRFDEVWQAYLDDPQDARNIIRTRDDELGAGIDILGGALAPLIVSVAGEALADLVKEPVAGFFRKGLGHLGIGRKREARRAALSGPAPDPASLEHTVMHALFLDTALRSGCSAEAAAKVADALVTAFTTRQS